MRHLASIQKIVEIKPVENSHSLDHVRVNGWWVVTRRGEFRAGDLVVYCEVDSWVPTTLAPFLSAPGKPPRTFNGVPGERLRTIKLRGALSQGLILPLETLSPVYLPALIEGTDVTAQLGVQLWERPMPAQLRGVAKPFKGGSTFVPGVPKTDQERVQNIKIDTSRVYEVSLKLDGSSMTVWCRDGEWGVCSRNYNLHLNTVSLNTFVEIGKDVRRMLPDDVAAQNIAIQGELMGPGIQSNRERFEHYKFFVFDIWDIDAQRYYGSAERIKLCQQLGLDHVPVLSTCATLPSEEHVRIEASGELTDKYDHNQFLRNMVLSFADRNSINAEVAEGIVYKALDGTTSFKVINNRYLLKEG